jgi:RNA polymerase sigma factor (TIGR02999 family)
MGSGEPERFTELLEALQRGDREARDRLFAAVYDDLKVLAHGRRRAEAHAETLHTTALVHEAYLRLCGPNPPSYENRRHFFGIAAHAMRQILIDHARQRKAGRRGGGVEHALLSDHPAAQQDPDEVIAVGELIERLAESRPRHAEVIGCRFFIGMTVDETAELLGISPRQVDKDWDLARAWLKTEIGRRSKDQG